MPISKWKGQTSHEYNALSRSIKITVLLCSTIGRATSQVVTPLEPGRIPRRIVLGEGLSEEIGWRRGISIGIRLESLGKIRSTIEVTALLLLGLWAKHRPFYRRNISPESTCLPIGLGVWTYVCLEVASSVRAKDLICQILRKK